MDKKKWSIEQWYIYSKDIVASIVSFRMINFIMYNMPVSAPYILLHRGLIWDIFWIFSQVSFGICFREIFSGGWA